MIKKYTQLDLVKMGREEYKTFCMCIEFRTFRLIGIMYKSWVKIHKMPDGSIIFEYE